MSPSDTQKLAALRIAQTSIPRHISDTKKAELPPPPPTQIPVLDSCQTTSCVLLERFCVYLCVHVNQDDPFEGLFYWHTFSKLRRFDKRLLLQLYPRCCILFLVPPSSSCYFLIPHEVTKICDSFKSFSFFSTSFLTPRLSISLSALDLRLTNKKYTKDTLFLESARKQSYTLHPSNRLHCVAVCLSPDIRVCRTFDMLLHKRHSHPRLCKYDHIICCCVIQCVGV